MQKEAEEPFRFQRFLEAFASFPRIFHLVWSTSPILTLGLGCVSILQGITPAVSVSITALVIDSVVRAIRLGNASSIWWPIGLQLGISLLSGLFSTLSNVMQSLLQEQVSNRIQLSILRHASILDLAFFENPESYDKIRQAANQSSYQPTSLIAQTFGIVQTLITLISLIVLLLGLAWWLAVIALLVPIPAFFFSTRYGWKGYRLMRLQSPERRLMMYFTMLMTTDIYNKEIKLFNLSDFLINKFWDLATMLYKQDKKLSLQRYFTNFGWSNLSSIVNSGIYIYVALQTVIGRITLGQLTLYTQTASQVGSSFQSLLNSLSSTYESTLYINMLFEFLAYQPRITSPSTPQSHASSPHANGHGPKRKILQRFRINPVKLVRWYAEGERTLEQTAGLEIEFRNVSFTYPGKDPATQAVLKQVSFTIRAGEAVALVGSNGAGKTTLVKLLTRLYEPDEGEILIGGRDIREYNLEELRKHIGVTFQDYVTYQLTARENIGVGLVEEIESQELVSEAARKSGANAVIEKLPQGYETTLGRWFKSIQESTQLSGGEWQKIALARAFMRDASILILDEPTSALDAQAEYDVFKQFRALTAHKTTLFISHRFSTVRLADRIFVLEQGKIMESGTHEELMTLGNRYAELFNLQAEAYR